MHELTSEAINLFDIMKIMGRRRKWKKERSSKSDSLWLRAQDQHGIPSEIQRTIWGILFLIALIVLVLGYLGHAGWVGNVVRELFQFLFGKGMWFVPFACLFVALRLFRHDTQPSAFVLGIGTALFLFACVGILAAMTLESKENGGYIGYGIALPFIKLFGPWVPFVILGGALLISILLIFGISFRERPGSEDTVLTVHSSLVKRIFGGSRFVVRQIPVLPGNQKSQEEVHGLSSSIFLSPEDLGKEMVRKGEKEDMSPPSKKTEGEQSSLFVHTPKKLAEKTTYTFPPLDLLEQDSGRPTIGDIRANASIIKRTLQNFGIEVEMGEVNIGPTVTQYTLKPAEGVKLAKITTLTNDLALALASHPIRIEAPIPGRSLVGIEIPNRGRTLVRLRNLMQNPEFISSPSLLSFVLGRDVAGNAVYADLQRMPHILIAGSTGSGKTITLNSMILSFIYRHSPETLRFILIDPKRVEFPIYNDLPHLLTPAIVDAKATVNALRWSVKEMEHRFQLLAETKNRDINLYNEWAAKTGKPILPYIVIMIDELADLMMSRGREVEAGIVRLAQMARAVGVHLVVATQRPSVEVITGLIKANITARIAFQVASQVDARTILDAAGAEKLLGRGDMLYLSGEAAKPRRIQGAYASEKEVRKVVQFINESYQLTQEETPEIGVEKHGTEQETKNNVIFGSPGAFTKSTSQHEDLDIRERESEHDMISQSLQKELTSEEGESFFDVDEGSDEELYEQAKQLVIKTRKASASFLQRRLRLGYARAARLIDMLEERGVVGPGEGAKPREVYIQEEES